MIFEGLLRVCSTCRACGGLMYVIDPTETSHPFCDVEPTELEVLSGKLFEAVTNGYTDTAKQIEAQMDRIDQVINLAGSAAEYTTWGWPVFPLARNGKQPAISKAAGGHGFRDATIVTERITKWWTRHPDHNIGLATGHKFDVIDVDTKDSKGNPSPAGINSFLTLLRAKDLPEVHGLAVTASGGMHLYVKPTGKGNYAGTHHVDETQEELRAKGFQPKRMVMPPGIDYRGMGGYVVAPPSTLGERWRSYTWLIEPSPEIKELQAEQDF